MRRKKLEKMSFVDIIESALLYALHPRYLAVMFTYNFLSISLVLYFILRLVLLASERGVLNLPGNSELLGALTVVFTYLILASITIAVVGAMLKGAFLANASSWFAGRRENLKQDLNYSAGRLPGIILLYLILSVFNLGGHIFELLKIPILRDVYTALIAIIFWFAMPILIINKQGATASIKSSWETFKKKYADMIVYWLAGTFTSVLISTLFFAPLVILTIKAVFATTNPLEISSQINNIMSSPAAFQAFMNQLPHKIFELRVPLSLAYILSVIGLSFTSLFWYAYTVAIFRRTFKR